ncbi:MAG TPA: hypothetical protein PLD20_21070 [Blastocatellia bacterium]|nr:hypothetical protein [Blastocatellia bacterium]HMV82179.1 hypothetical protein [Blastocatellia bacterium]HMX27834.1 hypothetical protein [Blastocatellia bacterium]HMY73675.1 hypothetical protein [Blastocatellia bacterium]HMZ20442.1 hypothetical protein [Blastocatellia bacterium]
MTVVVPLFVKVAAVANVPLMVHAKVAASVTALLAVSDAPALTLNVSKEIAPLPLIVLLLPVNVKICVPVLFVRLPLFVKLPAMVVVPVS